jgi:hypothetical protein
VGNGGDIIFCQPSAKNPLRGPYTLDFVAGYDGSPVPQDNDSLSRLATTFFERGKQDGDFWRLAVSLANFLLHAKEQIFGATNYAGYYAWISEKQGLVDIDDSQLIEKVPANCQTTTPQGPVLNLTQAVVRRASKQGVLFHYDPEALRLLVQSSPYQFSYMMIHEWLRGLTDDAQTIRDLNRLLHSRAFANATAGEAKLMLQRVGGVSEFAMPLGAKEAFVALDSLKDPAVAKYSAVAGTWVKVHLKISGQGGASCSSAAAGKQPSAQPSTWKWPCEEFSLKAGDVLWAKDSREHPDPVPLVEAESLAPEFHF